MSQRKEILAFLPWIIFSAGLTSFLYSAIIAFIINIVIARKDLLNGVVLEIGGCLFFAAMILAALLMHQPNTFSMHPNLWSNLAMAIIMLGSVLINKPFTSQYTQEGEHRFHLHLSAIWGALLLVAAVFSVAHAYLGLSNVVSTLGTIVAIILGVKANTVYAKWYYQRLK
jgi:hypothetical protein